MDLWFEQTGAENVGVKKPQIEMRKEMDFCLTLRLLTEIGENSANTTAGVSEEKGNRLNIVVSKSERKTDG